MRVLLCDDSPQIRELVRIVLELEGNEVVSEAENGREAVAEPGHGLASRIPRATSRTTAGPR